MNRFITAGRWTLGALLIVSAPGFAAAGAVLEIRSPLGASPAAPSVAVSVSRVPSGPLGMPIPLAPAFAAPLSPRPVLRAATPALGRALAPLARASSLSPTAAYQGGQALIEAVTGERFIRGAGPIAAEPVRGWIGLAADEGLLPERSPSPAATTEGDDSKRLLSYHLKSVEGVARVEHDENSSSIIVRFKSRAELDQARAEGRLIEQIGSHPVLYRAPGGELAPSSAIAGIMPELIGGELGAVLAALEKIDDPKAKRRLVAAYRAARRSDDVLGDFNHLMLLGAAALLLHPSLAVIKIALALLIAVLSPSLYFSWRLKRLIRELTGEPSVPRSRLLPPGEDR